MVLFSTVLLSSKLCLLYSTTNASSMAEHLAILEPFNSSFIMVVLLEYGVAVKPTKISPAVAAAGL